MKTKKLILSIAVVTLFSLGSLLADEPRCLENGCTQTEYEWTDDIDWEECTNSCTRDGTHCCTSLKWDSDPT